MKKLPILAVGLLCGVVAGAAETDFSIINQHGMDLNHLQKCLMDGWKAASPTDSQKNEAQSFIEAARTPIRSQKDLIKKDKEDLLTAWQNYPINNQDVEAAENHLRSDFLAVHSAVRDNLIRVLNLLSSDQKTKFNDSFKSCISSNVEAEESE